MGWARGGGGCLVEFLGGGGNGAAELGCHNGFGAVAILPFAFVEGLTDATVSVLSVDAEVIVVVHGRDGGVWDLVLDWHHSEGRSANPLKIISEADIVLNKDVKVQGFVLG